MKKIIQDPSEYFSKKELLRRGFFSGVGWALGVTIGFAVFSTLIIYFLQKLGGLPIIGSWIASIVDATLEQLSNKTPSFSH